MAGNHRDSEESITNINVTPLVDITLVLLIIFMVTATFIVSPSIKVELPKAVTAESSDPQTFSIVATAEGDLFLNGAPTDEAQIVDYIKQRLVNSPDLQVVISADKMVYHGNVVHLIDLVRQHGVRKFALNVESDVPAEPDQSAGDDED
ncbi:MAG: biopolymer transporter ExbD [Candidatus Alcyoniella australis]|nr:biopolymer transporter ExbD [Candidatus Alcyoniella australis]